jgi:hypothetical protein
VVGMPCFGFYFLRNYSAVYVVDEKPFAAEAQRTQRNDSTILLCVLCASAVKNIFLTLVVG